MDNDKMIINDRLIVKCKDSNNLFQSDISLYNSNMALGVDFIDDSRFAEFTHTFSKISHEPFDISIMFVKEEAYNKLLNNEDAGTLTPHCKDEYEWHQIR